MKDSMILEIPALSQNEPFARDTVAAFCARLDPSLDELSDVKTAVSEAVTNRALEPFFTTAEEEERSGMGFTIMQTFMTGFRLESSPGAGTKVYLSKRFGAGGAADDR